MSSKGCTTTLAHIVRDRRWRGHPAGMAGCVGRCATLDDVGVVAMTGRCMTRTAATIEVVASGLVYRNPAPHVRSLQASFPSLMLLPDGDVLCSFGLGSAFESADGHTRLARSRDGGRTWDLEPPFHTEPSGPPAWSWNARLAHIGNGVVVANGARWRRDDPDAGLVHPETLGFVPTELFLLRSSDGGQTWEPTRTIQPPLEGPSFELCSPIVALPDGRWLWPTSTWPGWDGSAPNGRQAVALVSYDQGATWSAWISIMDGRAHGIVYWEVKVVPFGERLLAVCWAHDLRTGRDQQVHVALSDADARSFGPPRPTHLQGQTTTPLPLDDERVLFLYRRTDPSGLWADLSRYEHGRWQQECETLLWGAARIHTADADGAGAVQAMSTLRFGLPTALLLPDGDALVAFWCVEECVAVIRWFRLRLPAV